MAIQIGETAAPIISMTDVQKWYGSYQALTNINFQVKTGERIVLCGPSGSGKSTLVRCINQLERVQKGRIVVDGIEVTSGSTKRPHSTRKW